MQSPSVPPIPTSAVWTLPFGPLTVTFDRLLKPTALNKPNWYFRLANERRTITTATILGSTVVITSDGAIPGDLGPDQITYYADPKNLRSSFAPFYPTEPFFSFPVT